MPVCVGINVRVFFEILGDFEWRVCRGTVSTYRRAGATCRRPAGAVRLFGPVESFCAGAAILFGR